MQVTATVPSANMGGTYRRPRHHDHRSHSDLHAPSSSSFLAFQPIRLWRHRIPNWRHGSYTTHSLKRGTGWSPKRLDTTIEADPHSRISIQRIEWRGIETTTKLSRRDHKGLSAICACRSWKNQRRLTILFVRVNDESHYSRMYSVSLCDTNWKLYKYYIIWQKKSNPSLNPQACPGFEPRTHSEFPLIQPCVLPIHQQGVQRTAFLTMLLKFKHPTSSDSLPFISLKVSGPWRSSSQSQPLIFHRHGEWRLWYYDWDRWHLMYWYSLKRPVNIDELTGKDNFLSFWPYPLYSVPISKIDPESWQYYGKRRFSPMLFVARESNPPLVQEWCRRVTNTPTRDGKYLP
jgi:hypothetical protein